MKNILSRSDWQVAALDLEASALGAGSYPIEVGVALVRGPLRTISNSALLIRPTEAWLQDGLWSEASAGAGLRHAQCPARVENNRRQ